MTRTSWTNTLGLGLLLALAACGKTETEPFDLDYGYEYAPLRIGAEWEYAVDSTIYDFDGEAKVVLQSSTLLLERITDTFTDNAGRLAYVVAHYERPDSAADWAFKMNTRSTRDEIHFERQADNRRLLHVVFPATEGKRWDPTALSDPDETLAIAGESVKVFKNWSGRILSAGQPGSVGAFDFAETLLVQLADDENLLERRYVTETYAKGVGLVAARWLILDTQDITSAAPWEEKAEKGFILDKRLIRWE